MEGSLSGHPQASVCMALAHRAPGATCTTWDLITWVLGGVHGWSQAAHLPGPASSPWELREFGAKGKPGEGWINWGVAVPSDQKSRTGASCLRGPDGEGRIPAARVGVVVRSGACRRRRGDGEGLAPAEWGAMVRGSTSLQAELRSTALGCALREVSSDSFLSRFFSSNGNFS